MTTRWNWRVAARCRTTDAEELFVLGARQRDARRVCRSCAVRTECLAHALDNRIEFGVWGGMTERERRALLRNRPDVRSWTDLLTDARDAHYAAATDGAAEQTAEQLARAVEDGTVDDDRQLHESA
jgi:WhiB family transcriptional regulator, redox-sensing transcriptional regulator